MALLVRRCIQQHASAVAWELQHRAQGTSPDAEIASTLASLAGVGPTPSPIIVAYAQHAIASGLCTCAQLFDHFIDSVSAEPRHLLPIVDSIVCALPSQTHPDNRPNNTALRVLLWLLGVIYDASQPLVKKTPGASRNGKDRLVSQLHHTNGGGDNADNANDDDDNDDDDDGAGGSLSDRIRQGLLDEAVELCRASLSSGMLLPLYRAGARRHPQLWHRVRRAITRLHRTPSLVALKLPLRALYSTQGHDGSISPDTTFFARDSAHFRFLIQLEVSHICTSYMCIYTCHRHTA